MKKFYLSLIIFTLCSVATTRAQSVVGALDFGMYFDNKEFAPNDFAIEGMDMESGTDFSAGLAMQLGLQWEQNNFLMFGVDATEHMGEQRSATFNSVRPIIYYQHKTNKVNNIAGIYPRSQMHLESYSTAFFTESYNYYNSNVCGVLTQYNALDGRSFAEFACDWESRYSDISREKFRLMSAARHYIDIFYYGYNTMLYHFAGQDQPHMHNVVDLAVLNPAVGLSLSKVVDLDIKLGALLTAQRDRNFGEEVMVTPVATEGEWQTPMMGEATLKLSYKGFTFDERLYLGENINPFFYGHTLSSGEVLEYGRGLYANESFFKTDRGIYNRAAFSYNRDMFNDTVNMRAEVATHYDGTGLGTQWFLVVSVNLFDEIYTKK